MAQVEFKCEKCGKLLKIDVSGGDQVTCTNCDAVLTVPAGLAPVAPRPMPQPSVVANGTTAPAPRVMNGARPQVTVDEPEPVLVEEDSALAAMSILMPWAISILFHVGLAVVLAFMVFLNQADQADTLPKKKVTIPDSHYVKDPGSEQTTDNETVEKFDQSRQVDLNPAPDMMKNQTTNDTPNRIIAIPTSGASSSSAFSALPGGAQNAGAKFFGSEAGGNVTKIVYVVDKSGSMLMNASFAYVQQELLRSIRDLQPVQQFQVIFFADGQPDELKIEAKAMLQFANTSAKLEAKKWIESRVAGSRIGKSDPQKSLEKAFQIPGGPPELIYILTDGLFPQETLNTISQLNPKREVKINTIGFRERSGEKLLKEIANQNGGTYKFISEEDFGSGY
ncbi:MAG: hypothetical protein BIFFINMI_01115 [Phycisphaerae bacterium]|nr:hypothetical protein [Phycisphaerae bacterium]